VSRQAEGYVVNPLTAPAAEQLFDARCTVEIGVVEQTVGKVAADAVDGLDEMATELARIVRGDEPNLAAFLRTSHEFHRRLVALAECASLTDAYERLGIPSLWSRTMADRPWWQEFDVVHHQDLVQAYRSGDVQLAKQLIRSHREQVKQLVRRLITEAGGEV
jgi:benzoate/toluate 1,2-dioxygenase reductase subunit